MTQEQKAKAYDEALKAAVVAYKDDDRHLKATLERIFHELRESDDERIRKHLISLFEKFVTLGVANECETSEIKVDDILSWLEKQGEQETDEWKEGNIIRHGGILALVIKGRRAIKSNGELFTVQYPNEWVKAEPNEIERFLNELEKQNEQNSAWSEEDKEYLATCIEVIDNFYTLASELKTLTKINVFRKEYAEKLKFWLKSLKDRVQPQPKQEWSKEDENNLLFLTSIIEECFKDKEKITLCGDTVCANFTKEDVIDRLKSLRPQSTWKPSDEQITWLYRAADMSDKDSRMKQVLNELLEQLKAL